MARNAQLRSQGKYSSSRQYSNDSINSGNDQINSKYPETKGNMKFTTKQLTLFWGGSFVFILIAFYLGFVAGKREGAIAVLDQAGEQMVRLELHTPREPYPKASEIGSEENSEGEDLLDVKEIAELKNEKVENKILDKEPAKIDFTGSNLNPKNAQVAIPVKSDEKLKDKLKEVKTQKFEEIYRGKDLFAPPPSKVVEAKPEPIIKVDPPKEVVAPKIEVPKETVDKVLPKAGWYVQIAAATSQKDGLDYYDKIIAKGLGGGLEPATIKDRSFYRVLVGPFPDQNTAMSKRQEVKQAVGSTGEPFIRQVQ